MPLRRLIAPLMAAIFAIGAGHALAQGGGPAAPPAAIQANEPAFGGPSEQCMKEFGPLRAEAERRGRLIKAASDRRAGPEEACALIKNFAEIEIRMISYVDSHAKGCRIPDQISDQLKNGHKKTEALQTKVCTLALERMQKYGPAGPTGDFDRPAVVH